MKEEEILEYNKSCAEFLNWEKSDTVYRTIEYYNNEKIVGNYKHTVNMKFHSDWNWIMKVLQRIEDLNFSVELSNIGTQNYVCYIRSGGIKVIYSNILETKKEAVVQAINQFLIWHNENN